MKATEQYIHVVLFQVMLYKVVLTFDSVDEILKCEQKLNEQYFPVMLFIMLCKVFPTFESVNKLLGVTTIRIKLRRLHE